jgi:hypothetical protein
MVREMVDRMIDCHLSLLSDSGLVARLSSAAGGQRPRFVFHRFASATIETGQNGDHEPCVEVYRALQQHGAFALVTGLHAPTITPVTRESYRSKVPPHKFKGPSAVDET